VAHCDDGNGVNLTGTITVDGIPLGDGYGIEIAQEPGSPIDEWPRSDRRDFRIEPDRFWCAWLTKLGRDRLTGSIGYHRVRRLPLDAHVVAVDAEQRIEFQDGAGVVVTTTLSKQN
jgi:hypothetical protein